jgi:DnaA family protein
LEPAGIYEPRGRLSVRGGQLPLALAVPAHARFDTFVAGGNAAALRHVREIAAGRNEIVWLWGGRGKTHLLQAACWDADRAGRRAMYLALARDGSMVPEMLRGLDAIEVLALDRVDAVAGDPLWEAELFTLLNAFGSGQAALLMAAGSAPAAAGFRLRDLESRAAGAVTYRLEPLGDDDQVTALVAHAEARGLELDHAAAEYLQQRVARDMAELVGWLDRLDRESLAAQRRVTIPFIRDLLAAAG